MRELVELLAGRGEGADLDRLALVLATIEYPQLDAGRYISLLDSWACELGTRADSRTPGPEFIIAANQYLFGELGFAGNSGNYYDPRNSCLNEVLAARTGIPITLSLVYMEVARRLDRPVYGIGLPGHFLVQYDDGLFSTFIDPYHGGNLLTGDQCFALAQRASGMAVARDPTLLAPVGKTQIMRRMIHNLCGVYFSRRAFRKAVALLDVLLAADPESPGEYKERGVAQMELRNYVAARSDLEQYLALAPDAADSAAILQQVRALRQYIAGLN